MQVVRFKNYRLSCKIIEELLRVISHQIKLVAPLHVLTDTDLLNGKRSYAQNPLIWDEYTKQNQFQNFNHLVTYNQISGSNVTSKSC